MKRKYSIALVICIVIVLGILGYGYQQRVKKIKESEETKQETIHTQAKAEKDEGFYLAELNGYLVVYREDKKTIYEYTNILVADLPENVQEEILEWKKMDSIQELYGFLENYSS